MCWYIICISFRVTSYSPGICSVAASFLKSVFSIQIKRKPIFSLSWCIFLILVLCFDIQNARTVRNEGRNQSWNFLFAACVCSRATKCSNQRSDYGCQTGSAEPCQLLVICFAWFSSYAYELLWYFVLKKQETISISNYFL